MTLFRNIAVSLMMVLLAQSAWARESFGLVSVGYGNPANISADLDLEEINPDQYPEYDLDPGRVWMARWIGKSQPFMVRYNTIDTVDDAGQISRNKYQSLVAGLAFSGQQSLNKAFGVYAVATAGVGVARFSVAGVATEALFDGGLEVGFMFYKKISLGLNGTLQIAGYPSETVASAFIPAATLSIWY